MQEKHANYSTNKQKFIIVVTVFIDIVGLGIVAPTLPFYSERFGASPLVTTLLFAVFSLCSFLSASVLGTLSDRYGRRPVLIASILGTSLGWFVFAFANSLPLLFLGRIIDGMTAGNISTAQSYLVDISTTPKERTSNLGLIGASFGFGFIVGPALGSLLTLLGTNAPYIAAGILALLNGIAAVFFLPETNKTKNFEKISLNPFTPIIEGFSSKIFRPLMISWLLFCFAFTSLQSIMTLYLNQQFNFDERQSGLILVFFGIVGVINQAFILRKVLLKKFSEDGLNFASHIILIISYIFLAMNYLWLFLIGIILTSISQSVLRITNNSMIAGLAPDNMKGKIIGITQSISSLASIFTPVIAGLLFEKNISWPWLMSSFFVFLSLMSILFQKHIKHGQSHT